jgi:hypothetical protein
LVIQEESGRVTEDVGSSAFQPFSPKDSAGFGTSSPNLAEGEAATKQDASSMRPEDFFLLSPTSPGTLLADTLGWW